MENGNGKAKGEIKKPALSFPGKERYRMPEIHSLEGNATSHGDHLVSPG